jgi:hypothetical protein
MPTQFVAGRIDSDGSVAGGTGFYVRALGDGIFIVEFDSPLPSVPAVVVKENYQNWTNFDYGGGDPRDNVVVVAVDRKGFKVITGNNAGVRTDRNFAFIAAAGGAAQETGPALISGTINADATVNSGSGFRATGIGDGVYFIDFNPSFGSLASVVLTQNYPKWDDFSSAGGNTLDNAVIVAANEHQFKYITGAWDGPKVDRNCSFIAAGPREGVRRPYLFGNVNADGSIRDAGSGGFKIVKEAAGMYTINFDGVFANVPAMVVTQNYRDWTDFKYASGDPRDNAVVVAIDTTHARVVTGSNTGDHTDRNFSFLILG